MPGWRLAALRRLRIATEYVQLPDDLDLLRTPERAQLAVLRVALTLGEQVLLGKHPLLRHPPLPSTTEPKTTALGRALLVRRAELHAMAAWPTPTSACS